MSSCVFVVREDHSVKMKVNEKINKRLDLARKLKKQWNMKMTVIPFIVGARRTVLNSLERWLGELEIWGKNRDHPNHSIVEISLNTEKSPGDLGDLLSLRYQWKKLLVKTGIKIIIWSIDENLTGTSKVSDHRRGWPEGSLFDSYYTKV